MGETYHRSPDAHLSVFPYFLLLGRKNIFKARLIQFHGDMLELSFLYPGLLLQQWETFIRCKQLSRWMQPPAGVA